MGMGGGRRIPMIILNTGGMADMRPQSNTGHKSTENYQHDTKKKQKN